MYGNYIVLSQRPLTEDEKSALKQALMLENFYQSEIFKTADSKHMYSGWSEPITPDEWPYALEEDGIDAEAVLKSIGAQGVGWLDFNIDGDEYENVFINVPEEDEDGRAKLQSIAWAFLAANEILDNDYRFQYLQDFLQQAKA